MSSNIGSVRYLCVFVYKFVYIFRYYECVMCFVLFNNLFNECYVGKFLVIFIYMYNVYIYSLCIFVIYFFYWVLI